MFGTVGSKYENFTECNKDFTLAVEIEARACDCRCWVIWDTESATTRDRRWNVCSTAFVFFLKDKWGNVLINQKQSVQNLKKKNPQIKVFITEYKLILFGFQKTDDQGGLEIIKKKKKRYRLEMYSLLNYKTRLIYRPNFHIFAE